MRSSTDEVTLVAEAAPQVARLQVVVSRLLAPLPPQRPTADGGTRTAAGWMAETTRETSSAAGRDLRP